MRKYERTINTNKGSLTAIHVIGYDSNDPTLGFSSEYFVKNLNGWKIVMAYWEEELKNVGLPSHQDIDKAAELLGDESVASVVVNSAFNRACLMRGMEGMIYDLYDEPDLMKKVLNLSFELRKQEIRSFLDCIGKYRIFAMQV